MSQEPPSSDSSNSSPLPRNTKSPKSPFTYTRVLFKQWRRSLYTRSSGKLLLISILIGLVGGVGAVVFHHALEWSSEFILHSFADFPNFESGSWPKYLFFLIPTLGGLLSGYIVYTFAPETEGHGTDAMIDNFHNRGGKVRKRVPLIKAMSSIITISTGGSAGHEGPTAQIGSGLGSILSRLFKVPEKMGRLLLLAGTASGLGAIFRAPLGGALTSVEVIYKEDFESEGFLPCIVASVVAYATFTQITGMTDSIFHIPGIHASRPSELFFFALLGILCTPVSWLFVRSFYFSIDKFRKLSIPRPWKPALGGLGVGLIAYLCPQAVGGGWEYLGQAMQGQIAFHILLWIVGFKIVTTCLTVGSGGSGGIFGPALFIGGMLGGAFGFSMHHLFPQFIENPATYILVGMGAFFAGAANAPIASIIMVCEITGNYDLLAPLMLASVIHIMLSRKWSIYKNQKHNKFDSPVHKGELNTDILKSIPLAAIFTPDSSIQTLHSEDPLSRVKSLMEESEQDIFPVVDSENVLVGLLGMGTIRKVILDSSAQVLVIVEDMMTPKYYLREGMDLHTALQYFLRSHQKQLPVMPPRDQKQEILGLITYEDIMQAYDEYL